MIDGASWITWALQGLLGFLLTILWQKLDKASEAIQTLSLRLAEHYAKKSDINPMWDRIHAIENWRATVESCLRGLEKRTNDQAWENNHEVNRK